MTTFQRKKIVKSLEKEFNFSLMPGFLFYETRESRRKKDKKCKSNEITNPEWFIKSNDIVDGSKNAVKYN
jgi:hypothetical protein